MRFSSPTHTPPPLLTREHTTRSSFISFHAPVLPSGLPGSHSTVPCMPKWISASAAYTCKKHARWRTTGQPLTLLSHGIL
jgi:hypothetical protein